MADEAQRGRSAFVAARPIRRNAQNGWQIGERFFPILEYETLSHSMRQTSPPAPAPAPPVSTTPPQPFLYTHDFGGPANITTTLAHAIADVTGGDVTPAGFTLYDYVDPDALDQLFKPKPDGTLRMDGRLTFTVWGYQVTVHSDGRIAILPPQQAAPASL